MFCKKSSGTWPDQDFCLKIKIHVYICTFYKFCFRGFALKQSFCTEKYDLVLLNLVTLSLDRKKHGSDLNENLGAGQPFYVGACHQKSQRSELFLNLTLYTLSRNATRSPPWVTLSEKSTSGSQKSILEENLWNKSCRPCNYTSFQMFSDQYHVWVRFQIRFSQT